MRFSCNGCRVLRKGCSDDCSIRACLQWIKSPEAQGNATKFYGRAGLLNLIGAGPDNLRPAIFKSLLQEACGRIVNPVYGSSGLISTGQWHLCETAVEAVMTGLPIKQGFDQSTDEVLCPVFKACDIRHLSKEDKESSTDKSSIKSLTGFKRPKSNPKSVQSELFAESSEGNSRGSDSWSVETVEDTLAKTPNKVTDRLDLTLGLQTIQNLTTVNKEINKSGDSMDMLKLTLGLPEVI